MPGAMSTVNCQRPTTWLASSKYRIRGSNSLKLNEKKLNLVHFSCQRSALAPDAWFPFRLIAIKWLSSLRNCASGLCARCQLSRNRVSLSLSRIFPAVVNYDCSFCAARTHCSVVGDRYHLHEVNSVNFSGSRESLKAELSCSTLFLKRRHAFNHNNLFFILSCGSSVPFAFTCAPFCKK